MNNTRPAFPCLGIPCVDASGAICDSKDGQVGIADAVNQIQDARDVIARKYE